MSNFDGLTVEIVNWDKYNPKRDQVTYSWLRLNNNISTDPKLFGLEPDQKYAWIVILCEVSKENKPSYQVNIPFLEHLTGVSQKKLQALFEFLERKGIITTPKHDNSLHQTTPDCSAGDNSLNETTPTNERTNVTNETYVHADSAVGGRVRLDFETVYQEYPRKDGKQEGLKICKAKIKTPEAFEHLLSAVRRYRAHCEREGTEKQYIKHFSTFMQGDKWKDWLEPDAGSSTIVGAGETDWSKVFAEDSA